MATGTRRALLLDVPVALLVGSASWFTAQASRWMRLGGDSPFERDGRWAGTTFGSVEVWWTPLPFVVLLVLGLAVRRIRPPVAFIAVVVAVTGYLALGAPYGPVLLAPMLAAYALTASLTVRQWVPLTVLLLPMLMAGFWSKPYLGLLDPQLYAGVVVGVAAIMVPAMVGLLRRNRIQVQRADREAELRQYAYEERLRIAREVHDVVGHSLSVISMQAGVALHVLAKRPEQAGESLAAIRDTSREALAELRSTLEVFRDPDAPLAPQSGLARLDGLVASLVAAGRSVTVDDRRTITQLPAAVDLAALRIVQESLTNVVRHTQSASATVTLTDDGQTVSIMVVDDGPPVPLLDEGSGIAGIKERARSIGGSARVSRRPGGGVVVEARLPVVIMDGDEAPVGPGAAPGAGPVSGPAVGAATAAAAGIAPGTMPGTTPGTTER